MPEKKISFMIYTLSWDVICFCNNSSVSNSSLHSGHSLGWIL